MLVSKSQKNRRELPISMQQSPQLVTKFPALCTTGKFTAVFTTLYEKNPVHAIPFYLISILILSSYLAPPSNLLFLHHNSVCVPQPRTLILFYFIFHLMVCLKYRHYLKHSCTFADEICTSAGLVVIMTQNDKHIIVVVVDLSD